MLCIYRISDFAQTNAYKPKLAHATKRRCLEQFLDVFGKNGTIVVADSVTDETFEQLKEIMAEHKDQIVRTYYKSGAYSFLASVKLALDSDLDDNTPVYLCEDDYLHLPTSKKLLLEGLSVADYCSLYDHPDKYLPGQLKPSEVHLTASSHWRTTESTTMTFATRIRTLREDQDIYNLYCRTGYPFDHEMFLALGEKGRTLMTSIPGASTHTELAWLSPLNEWK